MGFLHQILLDSTSLTAVRVLVTLSNTKKKDRPHTLSTPERDPF